MNLSKYLCSVTAVWEAGCRLHPLYRGATLQPHPPQNGMKPIIKQKKIMTQPKKKTAFVPCKSFKHDGATLTVGVAEVTVNRKPNPSEVYLCVKYFGDEGTPEAVVTFTPDKVIEIAEALLGFARVAHKQDGRV